jgi:hypothetical protein
MREMQYGVNGRKDSAKRLHVQVVFGSSSRASRESIDKGKALSEVELLDWWCAVDPQQAPQCVWISK